MTDMIERSEATEGDHVLDHLVVRFAGDSGDGMQLTGDRFTSVSASFGNDLSTMPDFPAEIRAPAGTVNGVSSFQVNIADHDITTPGDEPSVLHGRIERFCERWRRKWIGRGNRDRRRPARWRIGEWRACDARNGRLSRA